MGACPCETLFRAGPGPETIGCLVFRRRCIKNCSGRGWWAGHAAGIGFFAVGACPRAVGACPRGACRRGCLSTQGGLCPCETCETPKGACPCETKTCETPKGACPCETHHDLSPCNFVFRGEMPVAIIDFDAAAPGSRAYDLGYAAWLWLDIGSLNIDVFDQQRRFAAFLDAYGAMGTEPVLESMMERQRLLIEEGRANGDESLSAWATNCRDWTRQNLETLRNT